MNKTPIEWTDWSINPFKLRMPDGTLINSCVHVTAGCAHCYAEGIVRRWWKREWGDFPGYTPALLKLGTPVLVEEELAAVLRLSDRIYKGKADPKENKIFWNDMTDEFLDFWPDEFIDKLFAVRALTPNLIHQVLTKRADRLHAYFASFWSGEDAQQRGFDACLWADTLTAFTVDVGSALERIPSGLPNVHLGVSVEDQKTADERIPWLLKTRAAVRFLSYEPALGPIADSAAFKEFLFLAEPNDSWVIIGGESGPGARQFEVRWARDGIRQCKAADVPVFMKQVGAVFVVNADRYITKSKKGADMSEWPEDLRVREFPS